MRWPLGVAEADGRSSLCKPENLVFFFAIHHFVVLDILPPEIAGPKRSCGRRGMANSAGPWFEGSRTERRSAPAGSERPMGLNRPRTSQFSNPAQPNWSDDARPNQGDCNTASIVTVPAGDSDHDSLDPQTGVATSTTSPGMKVGFSRPPPRRG